MLPIPKRLVAITLAAVLLSGCRTRPEDPSTVVMEIESSPNNLDLRQGTDAQSERIGGLVFDALFKKDARFNLQPWLATRWEQPSPFTLILHLRDGVRFHGVGLEAGRPLEAEDVAYTLRSLTDGTLTTAKGGAFTAISSIDTSDRLTVTLHLRHPDASLLFNMSDGLFGVVPRGSGKDFGLHPIGSGPFRFVAATQDKEVVLERNPDYWAGPPRLARVRFAVIPDSITRALELQRGSADIGSDALTLDTVHRLQSDPNLQTVTAPSSVAVYANFNTEDPILRDPRVRQAIACTIDRSPIIGALARSQARPASSLLPPEHWAFFSDPALQYPHNLARARSLLDDAGYPPGKYGIRFHITLKTSTDESTRLLAAVLQQQFRAVGIDLQLRSAEFGTFYADVTRGAFQMYILRWIGSNEDPDIFRYAYDSASFPPKGGNRGRYANPQLDGLLRAGAATTDQTERRKLYIAVQQILARDLPGIPLWYPNTDIVHTRRLGNVTPSPSGNFDFLRTATLR